MFKKHFFVPSLLSKKEFRGCPKTPVGNIIANFLQKSRSSHIQKTMTVSRLCRSYRKQFWDKFLKSFPQKKFTRET
ncbi:hypothetical protein LEP1GSC133_1932 [Leptospira borgpetersenii serovar Pomona str. 200901868]|uniref:Uncharacterized protein n=1 Tax=Leptospira borgpetersenii serovar Pomona str. 200901868 TaxID=1192866 RepID=M6VV08_LEPBO|nr:hypothetical protein LEP1GSC133_1932 [Leptospira borgpetersenii serovar Pomona str. 200901868]